MRMKTPIHNDFKIMGGIFKATRDEATGKYYITGIASGVEVDRDDERMATSAIDAMKRAIKEGIINYEGVHTQVPLIAGHDREWDRNLGWVVDAEIDGEYNLIIKAELDPDIPNAMSLFKRLTRPQEAGRPLRLGFSVGGHVLDAGVEAVDFMGGGRLVFLDLALKEMTVTGFPAYAPSYISALTKSVNRDALEAPMEEDDMKGKNIDGSRFAPAGSAASHSASDKIMDAVTAKATEAEAEETVEKDAEEVAVVAEASPEGASDVVEAEVVEKAEETDEVAAEAEVEKTEESGEETSEVVEKAEEVASDPLAELTATVAKLSEAVVAIAASVASLNKVEESVEADAETTKSEEEQVEETDAAKSVEVEEAGEVIEKATEDDASADLLKSLTAAMSAALAPLMARVEALEEQPVDKSLSINTDPEEDEEIDVVSKFARELSGLGAKDDIIGKTLAAAVRK
jgi:hypothetical protein